MITSYLATYGDETDIFNIRETAWSWIYEQAQANKSVWNWEKQEQWDRFEAELVRENGQFMTSDPDGRTVILEEIYEGDEDDYDG